MSEAYDEYLKLQTKLYEARRLENERTVAEQDAIEDPILDAMDPLWWAMTQEERDKLDAQVAERLAALDGDS